MLLCIKEEENGGDGMDCLIKGILIGLLFGMPVGAVGALTVQRTLQHGFRAGLFTGLGSSAADCLYACVGVFGLTVVSDFLLRYQTIIHVLGGGLVFGMGIRLLLCKAERKTKENRGQAAEQTEAVEQIQAAGRMKMFLSSFAIGITNPAAVLTFLFAFSYFGITKQSGWVYGAQLVTGVFLGTYLWWGALSGAVSFLKKKTKFAAFRYRNQIFGVILILFGAAVFINCIR